MARVNGDASPGQTLSRGPCGPPGQPLWAGQGGMGVWPGADREHRWVPGRGTTPPAGLRAVALIRLLSNGASGHVRILGHDETNGTRHQRGIG
jgi:hypothetical protein